jgi:Flp pilus assembly protein TadD
VPITDSQLQTLARDATQRLGSGDFEGAEPLLAQVVAARPNSGQALHLLGQARLKLGRFAEAREPLERAAKFLPKEVAAQVNYARLPHRAGRSRSVSVGVRPRRQIETRRSRHRHNRAARSRHWARSRKPNAPMTTRSRWIIG